MSILWNLWYLHRPPWDTGITPPEIVRVFDTEDPPRGRALDIGCGTGTNSLFLARHGMIVTGIDFAWLAIWKARRRARGISPPITFLSGDFTRIDLPKLAGPFSYVQDIGCLHGIAASARAEYASRLTRLCALGAKFMLFAFHRGAAGLQGIELAELIALFGGWKLVQAEEGRSGPPAVWYRLELRS